MSASIAATRAQPQALAGQIKKLLVLASVILLAACSTVPRSKAPVAVEPSDGMHRVALLLPVTGPDADGTGAGRYQSHQHPHGHL